MVAHRELEGLEAEALFEEAIIIIEEAEPLIVAGASAVAAGSLYSGTSYRKPRVTLHLLPHTRHLL